MMTRRTISIVLFLLLAVIILPLASLAQSVGLAPALIRKEFKPGVPFELELATVNNGQTPVEMSVQVTDLWYDQKNEKVFSEPGTSPRSAANWIQFVPEHFQVPVNGTQKMRAIVTPPADAKGGYYATLFVISTPQLAFDRDKTPDKRQVYTNMRLGSLVLLSAEKTEEYKVEISNVKIVPPTANQGLDLSFTLANLSNTHVLPRARVAVMDSQRKLVAKAETEEKRFLPGQKDNMHVNWTGTLPAGNYTAILTVAYAEDRIETQQVPFSVSQP